MVRETPEDISTLDSNRSNLNSQDYNASALTYIYYKQINVNQIINTEER